MKKERVFRTFESIDTFIILYLGVYECLLQEVGVVVIDTEIDALIGVGMGYWHAVKGQVNCQIYEGGTWCHCDGERQWPAPLQSSHSSSAVLLLYSFHECL